MHIPRNSAQFNAIPRIFNYSIYFQKYKIASFFRNYSAIARNEMVQAEATSVDKYVKPVL